MIISIKELSKLLVCSDKTGSRIAKEIRELYGVDQITIYHVSDYLKIHTTHVVRYGCLAKLGRRSFVMEQEN